MIRTLTLAALAAALIAAPASAQSVRIPVAGKTTEQLHTEIAKAASDVCRDATRTATMQLEAYVNCVRVTTKAAKAQLAAGETNKLVATR